jgi:lipopolysaccharide transport system permease protein
MDKYRFRFYILFKSILFDLNQKYSGNLLGKFWIFLFPSLQLAIYSILYVAILRVRPANLESSEYLLLIFSGLIPLLAFSECLHAISNSINSNKNLLTSNTFPIELLSLRSLIVALIPHLFSVVIMVFLSIFLNKISFYTLLYPVIFILFFLFANGIGKILSLFSIILNDFNYIISITMMLLIIFSPFAYTPEMVPSSFKFFLWLNPFTYYVIFFQDIILFQKIPDLKVVSGVIIISFTTHFLGTRFFNQAKHIFLDNA